MARRTLCRCAGSRNRAAGRKRQAGRRHTFVAASSRSPKDIENSRYNTCRTPEEVETVFQKPPSGKRSDIAKVTYEVVEHDGGWAYRVDGVFSEAFPTHALAHEAAERAAQEQVVAGETTDISYDDSDGRWHEEVSEGGDRPETSVKD